MTIYLALLFFVVSLAYLGRRYGSNGVRRLSILAVWAILVLFAGLRSVSVGTDTGTYVRRFLEISSADDVWRTTEFGYNALAVSAMSISDSYSSLLMLIAVVVVTCYLVVLVRLVNRYETALFLFITLGFYTFFFNGARQGMAASICFLALPMLLDRRPVYYFSIVAVASLFHHSALIAMPLYFMASAQIRLKNIIGVGAGMMVAVLFLSLFVQLAAELINDKYAVYSEVAEGGGEVMTLFLVAQGLIFLVLNKYQEQDERFSRLLNIYLIGLIPVVAATLSNVNPSGLLRLHIYFSQTALLLWPICFYRLKDLSSRLIFTMVFLLVILSFFVLTTSSFSDLVPYQMNSEFVS